MTCPKCQSPMQEGYQLIYRKHTAREVAEWVEGEPERSRWFGLTIGDHEHREIQVYRCEGCGFLESYAK